MQCFTRNNVNDFERAIESSKMQFLSQIEEMISPESPHNNSYISLVKFSEKIITKLRSPIYPKKNINLLANTLCTSRLKNPSNIVLICPVASEVVTQEIPYFLNLAELFQQHQFQVFIRFLIVGWEQFASLVNLSHDESKQEYDNQLIITRSILKKQETKCSSEIIPIAPHWSINNESNHFALFFHQVLNLCRDKKALEQKVNRSLNRDFRWIIDFYARQNSFKQHSHEKAIYDLAIRRAIGYLYAEEYTQLRNQENYPPYLMVTSELHKRMILCYDSLMPLININTR